MNDNKLDLMEAYLFVRKHMVTAILQGGEQHFPSLDGTLSDLECGAGITVTAKLLAVWDRLMASANDGEGEHHTSDLRNALVWIEQGVPYERVQEVQAHPLALAA